MNGYSKTREIANENSGRGREFLFANGGRVIMPDGLELALKALMLNPALLGITIVGKMLQGIAEIFDSVEEFTAENQTEAEAKVASMRYYGLYESEKRRTDALNKKIAAGKGRGIER